MLRRHRKEPHETNYHRGNPRDGKHYWLTPADLLDQIKKEFCPVGELYDPCPYPKPDDFDGLTVDWRKVNYVNPPFGVHIGPDGKKRGMTAWVKKALEEQQKGNTTILVFPQHHWVHMLLNAGAEFRSLGKVNWLAVEDSTSTKTCGSPVMMFILKGKRQHRRSNRMTTVTAVTEETTGALARAGNHFPPVADWKAATQLDDEQLAALVADGAVRLAVFSEALKPYYVDLRERFHKKPKTARIYGCSTWGEYCEKVLDRTRRAMNYFIAGGNPGNEKAKQERARKKEAGSVPENGALTGLQADVVTALVSQGFPKKDAVSAMESAEGDDFNALFKSALAYLTGSKPAVQKRDELPAEPPQTPPIMGDPLPEPEPGTLEELRREIARMADVEDIERALKEYATELLRPLLLHHPYAPLHSVHVSVQRKSAPRIAVGDWVECIGGGGERLEKLVGKLGLGRVVETDQLQRPKIRWHNGHGWNKPYSYFANDGKVRVLYDWQASDRYFEAFGTYPSRGEPPNPPAPVKSPVASTDAANDEKKTEAMEVRETEEAPKPKTKREAKSKAKPQESPEDISETTPHGYFARCNVKPKNATETAQPWEIYLNVNGAKPVFCCRESSKQDAEAQMWKLDRRVEEHIASLPKNEATAEAAAM